MSKFNSVAELVATMDQKVITAYINQVEAELAEASAQLTLWSNKDANMAYLIKQLTEANRKLEVAKEALAQIHSEVVSLEHHSGNPLKLECYRGSVRPSTIDQVYQALATIKETTR